MPQPRATLGIFDNTRAFLDSASCRVAGPTMSKRVDLLAQRYRAMVDAEVESAKLTPEELRRVARSVQAMTLKTLQDAALLPGVLRRDARADGEDKALMSASYKLERAGDATLLAIVDACERLELDQADKNILNT